jgi:hypothetical protein
MSQAYQTRPSALLGLDATEDPYLAWCIDEGIYIWGNLVEERAHRAEENAPRPEYKAGLRRQMMKRILSYDPDAPEDDTKRYADPATSGRVKKVTRKARG